MKRFLLVLALFLAVAPAGCNEDNQKPELTDTSPPDVLLLYPAPLDYGVPVIADSVDVFVAARDLAADGQSLPAAEVQFWFADPRNPQRRRIGTVTQPIPALPDSLTDDDGPVVEVPEGHSLYTRRWYTGPRYPEPVGTPINSGSYVQLFAVAKDAVGNLGNSQERRIRVFNLGDDLRGPVADFVVSPSSGSVAETFSFDPSYTIDSLDPPALISVRWDFDGNPANGWSVDWDAGAHADEVRQYQYGLPGTYSVILQAHNSYLPDSIATKQRFLTVTNVGGDPVPPHGDYIRITAGRFTMGDSTFILDGATLPTNTDERPQHAVLLSQDIIIEKYEVTNRLYLGYLRVALVTEDLRKRVDFVGNEIRYHDIEPPADTVRVYLVLDNSRLFYDLDDEDFRIEPGYEDHPVTGVSWYGANAYAVFYGMRLPTEAEWERAARGGEVGIDFPWSGGVGVPEAEMKRRANYRNSGDPLELGTTPVGYFDGSTRSGFETLDTPSIHGCYDMAGNVAEWVNDWKGNYSPGESRDPTGPQVGVYKVVRGGSYLSSRAGLRASARSGAAPPDASFGSIGFRTAYYPVNLR